MISGKEIRQSLKKCEDLYNANKADSFAQQLILKLALIELCGWIEKSFDSLYDSAAKTTDALSLVEAKRTSCYSFKYKTFQDMLCFCVGVNNYNKIKNKFKANQLQYFHSALHDLSQKRDILAHNNHNFQSPQYFGISDLKKYCITILKSVNNIQKELNNL